ncbi:TfoX/Sxy family protein [uncultured Devosia sp.]|uniref:TfoX/Sxy family protein n=1 Tax=uncultured Devosia sp. TaxID=211434 RepID=UPI00260E7277|nr:TfoX/Sxy family protein [uncultured Devosia sp.]
MNARKPSSAAPEMETRLYRAAVAATEGCELKGATMPYTSINGNMYSFLDKKGVVAVRLGEVERAELEQIGGEPYVHESGAAMKEYVSLPMGILSDEKRAAEWLCRSLAFAGTLKPKATARSTKA